MKTQTVVKDFHFPPDDYKNLFEGVPQEDLQKANENVNMLDEGSLIMAPYGNRYYGAVVTKVKESTVYFRSTLGQWQGQARHNELFNIRLLPPNCRVDVIYEYDNLYCEGVTATMTSLLYDRQLTPDNSGLINILWSGTGEKYQVHWGYLSIGRGLANKIRRQRKKNIMIDRGDDYGQGRYYVPAPRKAAKKARRRIQKRRW